MARDCSLPEGCEKLIAQLTSLTYDFADNGKRVVESKKDAKKRGLPSPDHADSFLLSLCGIPVDLKTERSALWDDAPAAGSGWTG
jgi:phage terminase large subunit